MTRHGPRSGPILVFLHEGLGSATTWRDVPAVLSERTGLGALVYSRAGYGRSPPVELPRPLDFMEREAHGPLPDLLDAEGVARAILIGHSDGATIALVYAALAPERVLGVVAEAPHVFCEEQTVAGVREAVERFERGDLRQRLAKHHHDNVDVAFRGWSGAWLDPAFRAWSVERFLPAVRAPVLVVQGEDDAYGTLAQLERIRAAVPGPVDALVLPGCGHAPHKDARERVLARIAEAARAWAR